ncbi:Nickel and cobalt resistance protein CnrA [Novipirellula aureliae]|uniref:Nickel and cobalt resistance protein CnrA n=1 Tax=Novipirellula aureliae TaxID=2527966 RepID=A0A5C6DU57_9BACT|nr:efflux RND transporter permease subunit [Novipirellula aureliae]TWU40232.1 Nickel and cobalt resistance protein CnrA [Novipirellula aureliae]
MISRLFDESWFFLRKFVNSVYRLRQDQWFFIVVNDSIVLIDFINRRLGDGLSLNDAIIDTGRRRCRPVLLTSLTTIGGMLPILLETSRQAQVLIPMATSLSFGLIFGTVLVLILAPVVFLSSPSCPACHLRRFVSRQECD